ncbi:MAG: ATP-dependent sacrificial sulfur transferase LarE [bacterium]
MATAAEKKYKQLLARLGELPSLLVAFSGGADSTFLLATAQKAVRGRVLAVTARSPAYPSRELEHAQATVRILDAEQALVDSHEAEDPTFRANPPDRCYYCKRSLFGELKRFAAENDLEAVADGTTADELEGHRPGARAARELGIISPLAEVGLTKEEVKWLARENGVPNFERPRGACLASRFPYGEEITLEKLKLIEDAEEVLADLGFQQMRCRYYGPTVRIELDAKELPRATRPEIRQRIAAGLRALGFKFVTLDLDGYRTGSMDEAAGIVNTKGS